MTSSPILLYNIIRRFPISVTLHPTAISSNKPIQQGKEKTTIQQQYLGGDMEGMVMRVRTRRQKRTLPSPPREPQDLSKLYERSRQHEGEDERSQQPPILHHQPAPLLENTRHSPSPQTIRIPLHHLDHSLNLHIQPQHEQSVITKHSMHISSETICRNKPRMSVHRKNPTPTPAPTSSNSHHKTLNLTQRTSPQDQL